MTLPLYQIVNWGTTFENAKSMGYVKPQFVCVPNKHGGTGISNVQAEPDGAAIYGIWMWIVQMCSRQTCGRYEKIAGRQAFHSERAGYLTADGTRMGRCLGARELSNMFRRPIEQIHRCLQVVQSPEVGFIRLIEGVPEHLSDSTVTESGSLVADESRHPGATREDATLSNTIERTEQNRKKEKESSLLGAKAESDPIPTAPIDNEAVAEAETTVTDAKNDLIQHSEAKRLIGDLAAAAFERRVREADWSNPEKYAWLDAALPLERRDWLALDWLYRLPLEHEALKRTARCQSFESFLQNLRREVDKARSVRRQLGLNGQHSSNESAAAEPEPENWHAAHLALYGEARMHKSFFDYPPSSQGEMREWLSVDQAEVSAK